MQPLDESRIDRLARLGGSAALIIMVAGLMVAASLRQLGDNSDDAKRRVVTNARLVPGLQLCQPFLTRRRDGTVFFGGMDRLARLDASGHVADLGFGAWALARDARDNVYVALARPNPAGKASDPVRSAIVRIAPDDQQHVVGPLETTVYGIAADHQGGVFLQLTQMPRAYVDHLSADGSISRWVRLDRVSQHQNNWAARALAVDSHGNLYLGAWGTVIRIDAQSHTTSAFAGREQESLGRPRDGRGQDAELGAEVTQIAVDPDDNLYVVTHSGLSWLRKVAPDGGVTTIAGRDGPLRDGDAVVHSDELVDGDVRGQSLYPFSTIDVDANGNVYFLQCAANALRRITPDGRVETLLRGPLNPPGWG